MGHADIACHPGMPILGWLQELSHADYLTTAFRGEQNLTTAVLCRGRYLLFTLFFRTSVYNCGSVLQMGHLKTVIILAGGFVLFDESMPPKKLLGVLCALAGIIWYSGLKMQQKPAAGAKLPGKSPPPSAAAEAEPLIKSDTEQSRSSAV